MLDMTSAWTRTQSGDAMRLRSVSSRLSGRRESMRIGRGYGRGRRITCRFWGRPERRDTSSHPAIFAMAFFSRRLRRKLWLTWLRESHLTLIFPHSPPRGSVSEEDDGYGCGNLGSL